MTNKIDTLAEFLNISKDEAQNLIDNEDYLVLTDEEADERAKDEILNSLWAFNADFIINHCANYEAMTCDEYEAAIDGLRAAQERSCESINGLVKALIADLDEFVEDAIYADGRGHFISFYDGKENELNGLFIYRMN